MALFAAACVVTLLGLSPSAALRRLCAWVAGLGLLASLLLALRAQADPAAALPGLQGYAKSMVAGVGLLLLPLLSGVADEGVEIAHGQRRFSPLRALRGEFYAFALFSLLGVMLCATADDLIWLFLALELTSLPTYVMVAVSTKSPRSLEASVKYFFLGAFAAAIFLLGFALLYGATGSTMLPDIREAIGGVDFPPTLALGFILTFLGLAFKIAAFPMHFYTADVYQGSSPAVAAFLAFAPKAAGLLVMLQLAATAGWEWGESFASLPDPLYAALWLMAALTMTVGNVLATIQTSARRILAYSSIAHSGYMLVGLIAGPGDGSAATNGVAAALFYLLTYGVMNVGAFAALAALEQRKTVPTPTGEREVHEELDELEELRGLVTQRPLVAATLMLCALSLLGLPPLIGFFGKLALFTAGVSAGEIALVTLLAVNSAAAAFYYLRLAAAPMLESPDPLATRPRLRRDAPGRWIAGLLSAVAVVAMAFFASDALESAAKIAPPSPATTAPAKAPASPADEAISLRRAPAADAPAPSGG